MRSFDEKMKVKILGADNQPIYLELSIREIIKNPERVHMQWLTTAQFTATQIMMEKVEGIETMLRQIRDASLKAQGKTIHHECPTCHEPVSIIKGALCSNCLDKKYGA